MMDKPDMRRPPRARRSDDEGVVVEPLQRLAHTAGTIPVRVRKAKQTCEPMSGWRVIQLIRRFRCHQRQDKMELKASVTRPQKLSKRGIDPAEIGPYEAHWKAHRGRAR